MISIPLRSVSAPGQEPPRGAAHSRIPRPRHPAGHLRRPGRPGESSLSAIVEYPSCDSSPLRTVSRFVATLPHHFPPPFTPLRTHATLTGILRENRLPLPCSLDTAMSPFRISVAI